MKEFVPPGARPRTTLDHSPTTEQLSYTLDGADRIIAVAGDWDRFALANGGEAIVGRRIIDRPLDEFITGDITRMFVRTMLMSARTMQRRIQRLYRCDSPEVRRFMEMTILPGDGGQVKVVHRLIRSEVCRYPLRVTAAPARSLAPRIKRCSVCNRIRLGQTWQEIDEAVSRGRLPQAMSPVLTVVFGVCPECLEQRGLCLQGATSGKWVGPSEVAAERSSRTASDPGSWRVR
ncbi:hypothetical protein [Accumulibacter sp.]|uniref:hypothetical protein n=1 Tax=Accumulibacter sp. TaxID=2053492 RepID=UPI0025F325F4|nr:hypothetical protein [Accumulibacter sp.]MCM8625698.1 hypothetical protein [Accumulibacter sp.]